MGLIVATKAFFKLLFDRQLSQQFERLVAGELSDSPKLEKSAKLAQATKPAKKPEPTRSDALSLLAALQREARLVDLVSESLGDYSDEQVGSAAREVLEESGKVINRMFALQPLATVEDGESMSTPDAFDPTEFRLTGNVAGDPPYQGQVAHHGWKATKCEVPKWTGAAATSMIVAPVELEIG
ncbi:MAG: DUF2760 domain-containing protein [Planctomycetota bacterium]